LEKALDEAMDEVSGASFDDYGIKDALEILEITPTSITFVPMWVDDSHTINSEHQDKRLLEKSPFILNRPVKPGAPLPIAEALAPNLRNTRERWRTVPITFIPGQNKDPLRPDDRVFLNEPVAAQSQIRFIFHPEAKDFSDCAVTIKWEGDRITRKYKGKIQSIPSHNVSGVVLSGFSLRYFDNTNSELVPDKDKIPSITGAQINISTALKNTSEGSMLKTPFKPQTRVFKEGVTFVSLRNSRAAGGGLLIQQGTRIKVSDSHGVRMFSLSNVSGIKDNGRIELELKPKKGNIWKVIIELGFDADTPLIKKYSIEYPAGNKIFSQVVNLTTDLPLNFMNLSPTASYGFSGELDKRRLVNVTGDVELMVTRMDARGAMLFIRP